MRSSKELAEIEKYKYVTSSKKLVCVGESFGSYSYALIDEIYPPNQRLIPVRNRFGGIDYRLNPNYSPNRK
jgi:hypothetical protein